jgi:hypothetical protein
MTKLAEGKDWTVGKIADAKEYTSDKLDNVSEKFTKATGFELSTIWQMTFGYTGLPFPARWINAKIPGLSGASKGSYDGEKDDKKKPIVVHDTKIDKRTKTGASLYEIKNGHRFFSPVWLNNELLPICTISGGSQKEIVKTPMTGLKGSVKELIRTDDWVFNIKGLCFGYDREFPEEQIDMLVKMYNIKRNLVLENCFSNIIETKMKVIITKLDFPEVKGTEHVRAFDMQLTKDEDFELIIA